MRKYIKKIVLIELLLTLPALTAEMRVFDHDTTKFVVRDLKTFFFTIDDKYVKKLSESKNDDFDPPMNVLGRSPLLLIVDKNDKNEKNYQLYYYLEYKNDAYFIECEYKIIDGIIFGVRQKDGFLAKKMPKLVFGSNSTE